MIDFTILFGQGVSRLVIVLAQALVILGMGILVYNFQLIHGITTVLNILFLSVIGLVAFLGFGLFVSGLSNDENTIAPVANLIVLPQFLVAGTFFPIDVLPQWTQ
ncbi:MAG TPA: ABC transporter permease [Candidatus Nanoarchaeia archaeon]